MDCVLALPLRSASGPAFGALAIGAGKGEEFGAEELRLLEELAEELAFAIIALRRGADAA